MKVLFSGGCANGLYMILPDNTHTWRFPVVPKLILQAMTEDIAKYSPNSPFPHETHVYRKTHFVNEKTGATIFEWSARS